MNTREQVEEVVKRNMVDVLEIDESAIDATKSMKDLGATSLDIVEVVSCSMRELKVKVPRSELSKLTNIEGLVALLCQVIEEKQEAPAS